MSQVWGSTPLGQLFTSTPPWSLVLDGDQFTLTIGGKPIVGPVALLETLKVKRGAFWASVELLPEGRKSAALDGIPNDDAVRMQQAITASIEVSRRQEHIARLVAQLPPLLRAVKAWSTNAGRACDQQLRQRGWLSREFVAHWVSARPEGLEKLLAVPEVQAGLAREDESVRKAVDFWRQPFNVLADRVNQRHVANELVASRPFFDTVEKSPLSREQAAAVICFDNRVLLIASAGSGKTSTMVAKAGYALSKGYFEADKILMLAFNDDAAKELGARTTARLAPLGLPAESVNAKTFHAFGREVIGLATGKKPSVASWLDKGRDVEALALMVDEIKDSDPGFRTSWDMFRLVFAQDLPRFGHEAANPDAWDRENNVQGFRTLNNEVVKSRGELVIANWFFYNGIDYIYEAPYRFDTADAKHSQYRPDFYLPGPDVYLEHWALDASGSPPPEFKDYEQGMTWKRKTHAAHKTTLLETTMAELWSGKAFQYLERELRKLGVELDPNPDREVPGRKPMENKRLAGTLRAFLAHTKSNRLTIPQLRARLQNGAAGQFRFRHELFLNIFERLWERWEARLRAERCIDFEDMLNQAADCIEQGRWRSPYELVMVDEFQDASQARARLVAALVKDPGRYLFAVGDDWQGINRFAGADLSVMTDFESMFGKAVTLKLETTFRCPQSLCDISSQFVQKNPKQIAKSVRSARANVDAPVQIVRVADDKGIRSAISARIAQLADVHEGSNSPMSVYVLGRYKHDADHVPHTAGSKRVNVEFKTVHSSKGLEADHVILPRMTSDVMGFPSKVADDPVLQLAMPGGDSFEYAEERRLFYVALTRARQSVTLITVARSESSFVLELVRDLKLKVVNADGSEGSDEVCPRCGTGFLAIRRGDFGAFFGCTNYPRCDYKRNVAGPNNAQRRAGYARPRRRAGPG